MFRFLPTNKKEEASSANDVDHDISSTPTVGMSFSGSDSNQGIQSSKYREYGLYSPPKGKRAVNCATAEKRIKKDGFGRFLKKSKRKSDQTTMLVFLYGRGFMEGKSNQSKRITQIEQMIVSSAAERLMRVINAEGDRNVTSTNKDLYVDNMLILDWYFQQEGTVGFLPDMTQAKYYFRIQRCGNCFLHAPCVLLAYLAQFQGVSDISPVDVAKFVRGHFTDTELYKFVVKDDGGDSRDVLHRILAPFFGEKWYSLDELSSLHVRKNMTFEDLQKKLKLCGPGLVHNFAVHKKFSGSEHPDGKVGYFRFDGADDAEGVFVDVGNANQKMKEDIEVELTAYLSGCALNPRRLDKEIPVKEENGRRRPGGERDTEEGKDRFKRQSYHAMVLVGIRRDGKKKWLLFQNWWDSMQFVEVSDEYFKICFGSLTFVPDNELLKKADLRDVENCYSMNSYRVADCQNLDRAETCDGIKFFDYPRERHR